VNAETETEIRSDLAYPQAIYNEIDPFACAWIAELARAGHIAPGRVESRSIRELAAADVAGPGQRHFFAGIAGWSRALRLAGIPDDADVWTGSCPCQPFSGAGKRQGAADERHLWPDWFRLIGECRPSIILGEQVASGDGRAWLDAVFADLEGIGYACGAADLPAAGVGAPHKRQRFYFVAYANGQPQGPETSRRGGTGDTDRQLVDEGWTGSLVGRGRLGGAAAERSLGNAGSERWQGSDDHTRGRARFIVAGRDFWSPADWIACTDGKARPVEPGTFPLADVLPGRVGLLRGYGNAVVAELAATFAGAAWDAIADLEATDEAETVTL